MVAVVAGDVFGRNPSSPRFSPNYPKRNLGLNRGFLGARAPGWVGSAVGGSDRAKHIDLPEYFVHEAQENISKPGGDYLRLFVNYFKLFVFSKIIWIICGLFVSKCSVFS